MNFEDFKKAKENAKVALDNIGRRGFVLEASAMKKYITLLEVWNDKMVEALNEVDKAEAEAKTPEKIN